jgi:UDP-N-acetyl-D-glucosamine dehydrogenase
MEYSISPEGEKFKLPEQEDYREEFERLSGLASREREEGREIVVVMGLGFVGAVMAGLPPPSPMMP